MNLVKRLLSFDYAQGGEPFEPYPAYSDSSYRTTLFILRVTLASLSRSGFHKI